MASRPWSPPASYREQHLVVEEQVPLHGLEASQVLHLAVALLVVCPHVERALHQKLPQLTKVSLGGERDTEAISPTPTQYTLYTSIQPSYDSHSLPD